MRNYEKCSSPKTGKYSSFNDGFENRICKTVLSIATRFVWLFALLVGKYITQRKRGESTPWGMVKLPSLLFRLSLCSGF